MIGLFEQSQEQGLLIKAISDNVEESRVGVPPLKSLVFGESLYP